MTFLSRRIGLDFFQKKLTSLAQRILNGEGNGGNVDVFLLSNKEMEIVRRKLNARSDFKGPEAKKIAAEEIIDVLAFPEPTGFPEHGGKKNIGEIYINGDFAIDNTGALNRLLIHGLLHLLGYRHSKIRDKIKMKKKENEIFCRFVMEP